MGDDSKLASDTKALREREIKAALIDALFADGRIFGDAVVVSEMPVASMTRRADIVLANGYLLAFEIKSDGDKTSRLRGQIETYQKAFEGTVIVTGARHLNEVLECAPETVGVVAIDRLEKDIPKARLVRKPHLRNMGIEAAIGQMRADDLFKLARKFGVNPDGARDRFTLERRVRRLPAVEVRRAAIEAVKLRYRGPFEDFMLARDLQGSTVEALRHLQRPVWNEGNRKSGAIKHPHPIPLDTTKLRSLALAVRPRKIA